jgi:tRNA pseudouridine55 synthase
VNEILLIDKPKGWTSFDIVAKVRGMVRAQTGQKKPKVGHAGTLDPLATGLLIVLVGKDATKRQAEFMKLDKEYQVELKLGQTSTTDDNEGEKTKLSDRRPSEEEVLESINSFVGEIQQIPPIFSAIKVDGKRAYKQARAGKEVKMEPRTVSIYLVTDFEYDYPSVRFTAKVSSGTYIRSLARDIGEKLGTGAYMSNLRRTMIGKYSVLDAIQADQLGVVNLTDDVFLLK